MSTRRPFDLWEGKADVVASDARLTQAWNEQVRKDVNLAHVHLVAEVVFGTGDRIRAATSLIESEDPDGNNRLIQPILLSEPTISNDYDIGSSSGSRSVDISLPGWAVKPDRLLKIGLPMTGFGELSLLADGMPWEQRRLILRGDMSGGISFGGTRMGGSTRWAPGVRAACDTEPVELALQDPRESGDKLFPEHIVDESAWPGALENAYGRAYPMVFGRYITEAPRVVDAPQPSFLLAHGHGYTVNRIWQNDVLETANFTVTEAIDGNGVPVTIAMSSVALTWEDGDTVFADLGPPIDSPSLTDVIREAIVEHSVGGQDMVNEQLLGDAEAKLKTLRVRAMADDQTSILRWIEEGLLEDLPMVSMVWDSGKYGPVVTDWRTEPRASLENGTSLLRFRTSPVIESQKGEAFNSFVIRYSYDTHFDEFTKVLEANPDTSNVLAISSQALGLRPHPVIESTVLFDDIAAAYVLDWMVSHLSLPTYFVEYAGAASLFLTLRRGDTILLTDADLRWKDVRATVETIEYQRGLTALGLRIWQSRYRTGPFEEP